MTSAYGSLSREGALPLRRVARGMGYRTPGHKGKGTFPAAAIVGWYLTMATSLVEEDTPGNLGAARTARRACARGRGRRGHNRGPAGRGLEDVPRQRGGARKPSSWQYRASISVGSGQTTHVLPLSTLLGGRCREGGEGKEGRVHAGQEPEVGGPTRPQGTEAPQAPKAGRWATAQGWERADDAPQATGGRAGTKRFRVKVRSPHQ